MFFFILTSMFFTTMVILLLVTAASDLLLRKILLNYVLLSPIVSGGVRPKPLGQTPLGHNPPCFLPFVCRLGSGPRLVGRIGSVVRVSVNFQQKYPLGSVLGSRKRGYDQGACVRWGLTSLRLRRITSSPSQTLRRRLVRTTDDGRRGVLDARRRPSRLYFLHFATRTVYNIVDLYAANLYA